MESSASEIRVSKKRLDFETRQTKGEIQMSNPIAVNCDSCNKKFEIKRTHKKFLTDKEEGKVTIHYFTCPHCRKRYTAYVENLEVIKLKKKNKKLYDSIRDMRDQDEITVALQTYEAGVKKIKQLQSKLKLKFKI